MKRLLVIDDDSESSNLIATFLRRNGYDVLVTNDGTTGLALARRELPDLVITDLLMPQMDGYELTRQILSDPALAQTRVVFYTASYLNEEARRIAAECGVAHVLIKPVAGEILLRTVQTALQEDSLQRVTTPPSDAADRAYLRLISNTLQRKLEELRAENTARAQAEAALQESEEKYRTLLDSMVDGMFVAQDYRFVFVNPALPAMLGYTPETFVGKSFAEVVAPEFLPLWTERFKQRILGDYMPPTDYEVRFLRNDGRDPVWLELHASRVIYAGKPAVLGIVRDISERKRAEATLRDSEMRFRTLVDSAPVIIWLNDASGAATLLSRSWYEATGQDSDSALAYGWLDAVHPHDLANVRNTILMSNKRQKPFTLDYRLRYADGTYRWITASGRPRFDEKGSFIGYVGAVTDIHDRKLAESDLRASEQRFRQLAESLPQLVWTCEPDGLCDYLSPRWIDYTGVAEGQQLGFGWLDQLHPDDRERTISVWNDAVTNGRDFHIEYRIRRRDGVYRWFDTRAVRLLDSEGRTVKWFGANTGIHDERELREALLRQTTRLRALTDVSKSFAEAGNQLNTVFETIARTIAEALNGSCILATRSADGMLLHANALYNTDPELLELNKQLWQAMPTDIEAWPLLKKTILSGQPLFIPIREREQARAVAPPHIWPLLDMLAISSLILAPINHAGATIGALCIMRHRDQQPPFNEDDLHLAEDLAHRAGLTLANARLFDQLQAELAERTRAEEEVRSLNAVLEQRVAERTLALTDANSRLRELNAFKDTMLATASHDLRSPLGTIRMSAEMLREETLSSDAQELVEYIFNSSDHVINLINSLLDVSRLEAGKIQLTPITMRISEVVEDVLATQGIHATRKSINMHMHVDPEEPTINADALRLVQVLSNLISNAIKFTYSGGEVVVSIEKEPNGVCVRVIDSGLGIPKNHLPFVFEKFHQIHAYGTADERGSGLGLAIVKQLVELHGGWIEVDSEEGRGSIFSVHLPRTE